MSVVGVSLKKKKKPLDGGCFQTKNYRSESTRDIYRIQARSSRIMAGLLSQVLQRAGKPFFFFSSRRRHTRSLCDWSSDVCSSDLYFVGLRPVDHSHVAEDSNR